MARPDKLSVIVFSGNYEKVHYALATAAAAAAIDMPVTLFFTMDATRALAESGPEGQPGWQTLTVERPGIPDAKTLDATMVQRGVAGFGDLMDACASLDIHFAVCEMGLAAIGMRRDALRKDLDVEVGGLVTFLNDASATGATLFI